MKNKIYWLGAAFVLGFGLYLSFKWGSGSRVETKITLTGYSSPESMAKSFFSILTHELEEASVLVLGGQPEEPSHFVMLEALIAEMEKSGMNVGNLLWDKDLPSVSDRPLVRLMDPRTEMSKIVEIIYDGLKHDQRTILIVPGTYSSQLAEQNFVNALKSYKVPVTSISVLPLVREREKEKGYPYPCNVEGTDQTGIGTLGCTVLQIARANYRKPTPPEPYTGIVNQVTSTDFLILWK